MNHKFQTSLIIQGNKEVRYHIQMSDNLLMKYLALGQNGVFLFTKMIASSLLCQQINQLLRKLNKVDKNEK